MNKNFIEVMLYNGDKMAIATENILSVALDNRVAAKITLKEVVDGNNVVIKTQTFYWAVKEALTNACE